MISERIFNDKISLEEIIDIILNQQIDLIFQMLYSEHKVNNATSPDQNKEEVVA
ncbi:hypothetical protein V7157_20165 [Neobacillus drentensis]|uniref:hypothetical protein n=1 Tax=Neobacillus drentensis TaxID=220684 RepID=UPI003000FFBF